MGHLDQAEAYRQSIGTRLSALSGSDFCSALEGIAYCDNSSTLWSGSTYHSGKQFMFKFSSDFMLEFTEQIIDRDEIAREELVYAVYCLKE